VGKRYGPNDGAAKEETVEIREGQLTAEQRAELAGLFTGWDALSSEPYSGVPDGGDYTVRCGDKTVSGGNGVPRQLTDVWGRLQELAKGMPVVK
jgi:hypothetical protein